jgi:hypothetical protein
MPIVIDVEVGDTILTGRFKNKKTVVKNISIDDHGMPMINGKKATTFRLTKSVEEKIVKDKDGYRKYKKFPESDFNEPSKQTEGKSTYKKIIKEMI